MKKLFLLLSLAASSAYTASCVYADMTHTITSSAQLTVNPGITQAERIGSTFSISGNGVNTSSNTLSNGLITSGGVYAPGAITVSQDTPGNSFSFSQSYTQGDLVPVAAVTTGNAANFSDVVSHAAGVRGDLAGEITTSGAITLTPGDAGTIATGSVVVSVATK